MFTIAMVQPNFKTGPKHLNSFYLPYTLGCIWSYAVQSPKIKQNFKIGTWVWKRDMLDTAVAKIVDHDIAALSMYVWNRKYVFSLAEALKAANPNIKIVLGGPEVPHRDPDFFLKYPYIDTVVIGEGERAFTQLLEQFADGVEWPQTIENARMTEYDWPSPYTTGVFDELIEQHPEVEWSATYETNRGCPYKCTYCDWGSMTGSKVVKFDLERQFAELEWFSKKKINFVSFADANFGLYKERDRSIITKFLELFHETGYPNIATFSYAKNTNSTMIDLIKYMNDGGIKSNYMMSLQTTHPPALDAIKRNNMKSNNIEELSRLAKENGLSLATELILGLPEETLESFKEGFEKILRVGVHGRISVYFMNLIENAPIQSDLEKYNIKTFSAQDQFYGVITSDDNILESVPTVMSTSTMSRQDIEDAAIYTWYMMGLHCEGISDIAARYMYNARDMRYTDFYEGLIQYLKTHDSRISALEDTLRQSFRAWQETGVFEFSTNGFKLNGWLFIQSFMLIAQASGLIDSLVQLTASYLRAIESDTVARDYALIAGSRLKQFNRYIKTPYEITTYSNFWEVAMEYEKHLTYTPIQYRVYDTTDNYPETLSAFLDYVTFWRNRMFVLNGIDRL